MSKPTERSTRDRLIDATVTLMRTKGAAGTGTKEILDAAAAPRGSFYFHFPDGKDQLVLEAMHRAAGETLAMLESGLDDGATSLPEQIDAIFEAVGQDLERFDYAPGCAVAVTTVESASVSPTFQQSVAKAFDAWTTAVSERLTHVGVSTADAAEFADALVAGLEGATILARARHSTAPLRNTAAVLGRAAISLTTEQ